MIRLTLEHYLPHNIQPYIPLNGPIFGFPNIQNFMTTIRQQTYPQPGQTYNTYMIPPKEYTHTPPIGREHVNTSTQN